MTSARLFVLLFAVSAAAQTSQYQSFSNDGVRYRSNSQRIGVPLGEPVRIDGRVGHMEWDDAESGVIELSPDLRVAVRFKHDAQNLYILFDGLPRGYAAEVMLDAELKGGSEWSSGQKWFYAGMQQCDGDGDYRPKRRDSRQLQIAGAFCSNRREGWEANNIFRTFSQRWGKMEMRIPLATAGIVDSSRPFGIAFSVTDGETRNNYPKMAATARPSTWAIGSLKAETLAVFKLLR